MKAHLFSGLYSFFARGHFTDGCSTFIIYGGDEESAWNVFQQGLLRSDNKEEPNLTKVEKIVGAPVLEQLLTETGYEPINWPNMEATIAQSLENADTEEAGQGYWVDPNECFGSGVLPANLESLQNTLPDELRSGLNWNVDKTYFFVVTVLSPPALEPDIADWTGNEDASGGDAEDPEMQHAAELSLRQRLAPFPEMADKELAVLARARNSVVAAWLWKKYALTTPLAQNRIRIDSWCGAASLEAGGERPPQ
jgi:hypothetical protein